MYIRNVFVMSALLISLNACADPHPGDASRLPEISGGHALDSTETVDMDLKCGAASFVLLGSGENARVEASGTGSTTLTAPGGMQGFVPVGMGCATSASGEHHLVVQYGETPFGCKVCEWFFIYDAQGVPMNDAIPPTRGYGETLEANNDGYDRLLSDLGLRHPKIEYPELSTR
ncbi:MAG: hypothetical protein ACTIJY_03680 [Luteimonas sp.]